MLGGLENLGGGISKDKLYSELVRIFLRRCGGSRLKWPNAPKMYNYISKLYCIKLSAI